MYSAEYVYSSEYAIEMAYIDMNAVLPEVEDGSDKLLEKYLGEEEEEEERPNKISMGEVEMGMKVAKATKEEDDREHKRALIRLKQWKPSRGEW